MKLKIPENILSLMPYKAGKPIEELEREYGIKGSIKLASNENPLGPSPKAITAMKDALANLHRYPDSSGYYLISKLSDKLSTDKLRIAKSQIVLGNGSDDVIGMLARVFLTAGDEVIMTAPSFLMYEIFVRSVDAQPVFVPLTDLSVNLEAISDAVTEKTRIIFLTNPNNPTGSYITRDEFDLFLSQIPSHVVVVLDEAYIEFATDPKCLDGLAYINDERPLAVLRTFSKAYGLAGIRIGYGVMPEEIAALLNRVRQPFNANSLALAGAVAALDDDQFLNKTKTLVHTELAFLTDSLKKMGVTCFPTQANFFLIDVKQDADRVFNAMLKQGVIVRSMISYGYRQYIRVNVGTHEENVRFLNVLENVIKERGQG